MIQKIKKNKKMIIINKILNFLIIFKIILITIRKMILKMIFFGKVVIMLMHNNKMKKQILKYKIILKKYD